MGVYFDAVLNKDLKPLFNGTPEETVQWILDRCRTDLVLEMECVCVGRTLGIFTIDDYLKAYDSQEKQGL